MRLATLIVGLVFACLLIGQGALYFIDASQSYYQDDVNRALLGGSASIAIALLFAFGAAFSMQRTRAALAFFCIAGIAAGAYGAINPILNIFFVLWSLLSIALIGMSYAGYREDHPREISVDAALFAICVTAFLIFDLPISFAGLRHYNRSNGTAAQSVVITPTATAPTPLAASSLASTVRYTLSGTVTLKEWQYTSVGTACIGVRSSSGMTAGSWVRLTSASAEVRVGSLSVGTVMNGADGLNHCVMAFTVAGVPESAGYALMFENAADPIGYAKTTLDSYGWRLNASAGN